MLLYKLCTLYTYVQHHSSVFFKVLRYCVLRACALIFSCAKVSRKILSFTHFRDEFEWRKESTCTSQPSAAAVRLLQAEVVKICCIGAQFSRDSLSRKSSSNARCLYHYRAVPYELRYACIFKMLANQYSLSGKRF